MVDHLVGPVGSKECLTINSYTEGIVVGQDSKSGSLLLYNERVLDDNKDVIMGVDNRVRVIESPDVIETARMMCLLGNELCRKMQIEQYAEDSFNRILDKAIKEHPNKKIGIRAVLIANEEGVSTTVPGRDGIFSIATQEQVLRSGGELSGLRTLITVPGISGPDGLDTDMSKLYFRYALTSSVSDSRLAPAVLVYDLEGVVVGGNGFDIEFADEVQKARALLGLYEVSMDPLRGAVG